MCLKKLRRPSPKLSSKLTVIDRRLLGSANKQRTRFFFRSFSFGVNGRTEIAMQSTTQSFSAGHLML
jgi:hypothetical protein